jgi:fluoride exporter
MRVILLVALGSALGGVARYWLSGLVATRVGEVFPWGTLIVNVLGCGIIGLLAGLHDVARVPLSADARAFLMIGILGGFTTFSSFSLQTLQRLQEGDWLRAGLNVLLSVVLCLAAVALGYWLARLAD